MKTLFAITCISSLLILGACKNASKEASKDQEKEASVTSGNTTTAEPVVASVKKYPVKSAIVTFESDMMGIKVKSVLYFDDYGMKEIEETYTDEAIKERTVCDGKQRLTINFNDKTAWIVGDCYRGIAYKFDWDEISQADQKYKVQKESNMNIAGKDCESYSMNSGDYPTIFAGWNNICLYQETKSKYGTVIKKAVKIEENADIPAELFKVPDGFETKKMSM